MKNYETVKRMLKERYPKEEGWRMSLAWCPEGWWILVTWDPAEFGKHETWIGVPGVVKDGFLNMTFVNIGDSADVARIVGEMD